MRSQGPAAESSLRVNDVLLAINGCDASSLEELVRGLCRGVSNNTSILQLRVQTPGQAVSREVSIQRSAGTAPTSAREREEADNSAKESGKENASVNCTTAEVVEGYCQEREENSQRHELVHLEMLRSALAEAEEKLSAKDRELENSRAQLAQPRGDNWAALDRFVALLNDC